MDKDYQVWHKAKTKINNRQDRTFYNERDVWWCSIGLNVGFEMDGKGKDFARPVLVIKGFSKEVFLCVPLTTKLKEGKYYHSVDLEDLIPRKAVLSQIRLIDTKRLEEKIGMVGEEQFKSIKQAIIDIIA